MDLCTSCNLRECCAVTKEGNLINIADPEKNALIMTLSRH